MILGSFLTYLGVFEVKNNENDPIDLNFDTGNQNNMKFCDQQDDFTQPQGRRIIKSDSI